MSDVTTWPDGLGRWHANLHDTGDAALNAQLARCAILTDLSLQYHDVAADRVTVRRVHATRRVPGMPREVEYVEDWIEHTNQTAATT